jgi:U32 family peptidase
MTKPGTSRPELLAPAGDWECLRAAVANGADAVYFGLSRFSARQRAANFTREELPEVLDYLHARNVRGYVAFNTLVFSDELEEASSLAADLAAAGADAAILQDLGLARLIHRMAPTLPLHASTQMTLTEPRGIELVRSLGISRVILARELSIEEIDLLRQGTDMPLEVFVHGALCMSYSGQCLASEALWGRSANRGICGQACRLPYSLRVDGRHRNLGERQYLLSTKDLAAYDRIADLVRLGIAGFKIEGRLKSAHYVAAATQVYRAAIDSAAAGRRFKLDDAQQAGLAQSFSRGFTHGFLDGTDHANLVHGLHPKSRGIRLGTVAGTTLRGVIVDLVPVAALPVAGDGVVFDEGHPAEDEQGGRLFAVDRLGRGQILLVFGPGAVNLGAVSTGAAVWKTDDPRLRRELEKSYARETVVRRVPLSVRLEARAGSFLRVRASDDTGHAAEAESDAPLEVAVNRPLTEDLVREQFGRLGETPFELADIEIAGDTGPTRSAPVMVPKSVLNDVRRKVVAALIDDRRRAAVHPIADPQALASLRGEKEKPQALLTASPPAISVLCRNLDQLTAVLNSRPTMVYCDFADPRDYAEAVSRGRAAGTPVSLATVRLIKPGEERFLAPLAEAKPDAILVRSLAALAWFRKTAPAMPLIGDFSLNVANELTASLLVEAGAERITTALDLNLRQLAALANRFSPGRLEPIIHLHVPMMYTEHCPAAANLSSSKTNDSCGRPCATGHRIELEDRVGARHTMLFDARCGCTIISGHVQSAIDLVPAMTAAGLRQFRVELLDEKPGDVTALLDLYGRAVVGRIDPEEAATQLAELVPAGVRRGTWDFA